MSVRASAIAFALTFGVAGQALDARPDEKDPIVVEGEKARKVCYREAVVGSIAPRRVCRTRAEIEQDAAQAETGMQNLQRGQMLRGVAQANREASDPN